MDLPETISKPAHRGQKCQLRSDCWLPAAFIVLESGSVYKGDAVWSAVCVRCAIVDFHDQHETVWTMDWRWDDRGNILAQEVDPRRELISRNPAEFGLTAPMRWRILRNASEKKRA